jgi:50S ribosomal subunit-associated GTPase HflX
LLIHLVDISNPRGHKFNPWKGFWRNYFARIPSLLILNKADLLDAETVAGITRQLAQGGEREVVAISANDKNTLPPFLDKLGKILAQDLAAPEPRTYKSTAASRIA